MTINQPPRFAGRLLQRLVPAQDHDVLLGDLCEEYRRGRSAAWYWLQVLAAIAVGSWKDIRANKLVAVRAGLVGVGLIILSAPTSVALQHILTGAGFLWHGIWIGLPRYWRYPYPSSYFVVLQTCFLVFDLCVGWIVVRLHRSHGLTMVFACCGAAAAFRVALLAPHLQMLPLGVLSGQLLEWLLLMLGGSLATRRPEVA